MAFQNYTDAPVQNQAAAPNQEKCPISAANHSNNKNSISRRE
jgi:hypothetical protein